MIRFRERRTFSRYVKLSFRLCRIYIFYLFQLLRFMVCTENVLAYWSSQDREMTLTSPLHYCESCSKLSRPLIDTFYRPASHALINIILPTFREFYRRTKFFRLMHRVPCNDKLDLRGVLSCKAPGQHRPSASNV